jgi:Peptidase family C78
MIRCLVHDFDFRKPPFSGSLIKYVQEYFKCPAPQSTNAFPSCKITDLAPLYFQHSGHSRTIVGIEHLKSGKINLLIFDPSHKPSQAIKQYVYGDLRQKKDTADSILKPYRVSLEEIAKKKEYQILRSSLLHVFVNNSGFRKGWWMPKKLIYGRL